MNKILFSLFGVIIFAFVSSTLGIFAEHQLGKVLGGISNTMRTYIGNLLKAAQEVPLTKAILNDTATGSVAREPQRTQHAQYQCKWRDGWL